MDEGALVPQSVPAVPTHAVSSEEPQHGAFGEVMMSCVMHRSHSMKAVMDNSGLAMASMRASRVGSASSRKQEIESCMQLATRAKTRSTARIDFADSQTGEADINAEVLSLGDSQSPEQMPVPTRKGADVCAARRTDTIEYCRGTIEYHRGLII